MTGKNGVLKTYRDIQINILAAWEINCYKFQISFSTLCGSVHPEAVFVYYK